MNLIERALRRVDATQQRHKPSAFVFGVVKKYGDDNGGVLVANLAYSGFVSLFPPLLILVTILGLVASGDPALRQQVLNAVAKQVPLIGHQLAGNVHQLRPTTAPKPDPRIAAEFITSFELLQLSTNATRNPSSKPARSWLRPAPSSPTPAACQ
jgi:hypothetical protein